MSFEMFTAFRGKVIIKDEYKGLVELINTRSWEEAAAHIIKLEVWYGEADGPEEYVFINNEFIKKL
ncbi:hypothetical protein [Bacillus cereus]|uniref:Uncharacterized protein n=1 Tax=Bacillus cereus TaxID=1396 RepID=A0A1S9UF58_BACCE|nr:hypothetical protein [Bacillus cereus]OOR20758.1 hypothetical protein BW892_23975 [Bacillus cereus]